MNPNTTAGVQTSLQGIGAKIAEPRELPKVGDTLKFRYHPYGGSTEILDTHALTNGEQIIEVQVVAIKKAIVSFE